MSHGANAEVSQFFACINENPIDILLVFMKNVWRDLAIRMLICGHVGLIVGAFLFVFLFSEVFCVFLCMALIPLSLGPLNPFSPLSCSKEQLVMVCSVPLGYSVNAL